MTRNSHRLFAVVVLVALTLVAACSNSDAGTSTPGAPEGASATESASAAEGADTPSAGATTDASEATATAAPEATTSDPAPAAATGPGASVDNVIGHATVLAEQIGVRAAGTDGERAAAEYIAGVLEAAGYDTVIEPFPVTTQIDGSSLTIETGIVDVRPFMMNGSATAEATGPLVYGGLGAPEDLAALDLQGRVLLLDRGVVTFGAKARNAELAGAIAVVIANNEPGAYSGNLGDRPATIPVVAVTRNEGAALRPLADAGAIVTVRASIESIELDSQNVVGRGGETCRFYIGGHYDSVPAGPGANDNASGTALMLELARIHRVNGLCVVAFGAEEIGLIGSQAYVADHNLADAIFMLNFDMAGRLDRPLIIGDAALSGVLLAATQELPIRAGQFPSFASSDHVSFLNAGIPAVTITSGDDPLIHTASDDIDNVSPEALQTMLEIGDRTLAAALAAAG